MSDIPKIVLDPRDDEALLSRSLQKVVEASNGQLTDTASGSPLRAIMEGQVFAIAELLFYLNLLPEALALEVFRLAGVVRSPGTKATGFVNFLLTSQISHDFVVSPGYVIPYLDTSFITTEELRIPSGAIEASVNVESSEVGAKFNVPAYGINIPGDLNYLNGIYNPLPIAGGSDIESLNSTVQNAQAAIRYRAVLVTSNDYEIAAQKLLGEGSKVKAEPLLDADKKTRKPGQVHLFCFDIDGEPITPDRAELVKVTLSPLSFVASRLWVSPAVWSLTRIDVIAQTEDISGRMGDLVFQALLDYTSYQRFPLGSSLLIKELEYVVRTVEGIDLVTEVRIDDQYRNKPMENLYSMPLINEISVSLVNSLADMEIHDFSTGLEGADLN